MKNNSINITTEEKQNAFLKVYPTAGTISSAARAIRTNRKTVNRWLKSYPDFSEKFEEARKEFVEELEDIAYGLVKEMSDKRDYKANPTLLIFMLNANHPEKYRGIADTSTEARDVLSELRKMARATVVTVDNIEEGDNSAQRSIVSYNKDKKALSEKFGSLKNGNPDSD